MNLNEAQAQCLVSWQWSSRAIVTVALRELEKAPGLDLCGILVRHSRLTPAQASRVRMAVCDAIDNGRLTLTEGRSTSPEEHMRQADSLAQSVRSFAPTEESDEDLVSTIKYPGADPLGRRAPGGPPSPPPEGSGQGPAELTANYGSGRAPSAAPARPAGDDAETRRYKPLRPDGRPVGEPASDSGRVPARSSSGEWNNSGSGEWAAAADPSRSGEHPGPTSGVCRTPPTPVEPNASVDRRASRRTGSFMGLSFPRFRIERELASGGMGVIFKAHDKQEDQKVALKVLFRDEKDEIVVGRFRREARVASKLSHPNIVRVIESGEENGDPYLAMEFVEGKDLGRLVLESLVKERRPPTVETVLPWFIAIADALRYCHEQRLIHRDVKPPNILIEDKSGRPVLVDFGLVKRDPSQLTTTVSLNLSRTGQIVGTPAFMAPEQLDAKGAHGEITEASDAWGLASTMFYALTGAAPFPESNAMALYVALLTKQPRRLSELDATIDPRLDALISDCLQRAPERRPTMAEINDRLRRVLT